MEPGLGCRTAGFAWLDARHKRWRSDAPMPRPEAGELRADCEPSTQAASLSSGWVLPGEHAHLSILATIQIS